MLPIFTLIKQKLTTPLVLQVTFGVLVATLFLDIKYALMANFAYFLGEKKDFTIIFSHLSDILLVCLVLFICIRIVPLYKPIIAMTKATGVYLLFILVILAITSYYINFNNLLLLTISAYILIFITKLIVLHGTLTLSLDSLWDTFKVVFLSFIGLEAVLGVCQFYNQASLGLQKVGESVIGPYMFGVAKVEVLGQVFIRSYGTFPHPNVFGAFLIIGLLISLTSYWNANFKTRLLLLLLTTMQVLALALTFSRSAWFVAFITLGLFLCLTWNRGLGNVSKLYLPVATMTLSVGVICVLLYPFVLNRGQVYGSAYAERVSYNSVGVQMATRNPIFGLGPGQSLLHMKQYMGSGVQAWEVQPIHNYYLLFAAELGVPVLLAFALYVSMQIKKSLVAYRVSRYLDIELVCLLCCVIAVLILMMFDHYFYTLQSPAILFWVVLGLLVNKLYRLERVGKYET